MAEPVQWEMVPDPGEPDSSGVSIIDPLLLVFVAAFGPSLRTWSITQPASRAVGVFALVLVALGVLASPIGRNWWSRLAVAAAVAVAVSPLGGVVVGVWAGAGIVLAEWSVRGRPPLPWLPRTDSSAKIGVAVLTAVAAWRGQETFATVAPLVITGLGFVLCLVGAYFSERFSRIIESVGVYAGRLANAVLFGLLAVPVLLVPWLARRLLRVDSLDGPTGADSQWVALGRGGADPRRRWAVDGASRSMPVGWRLRMGVAGLLQGALVAVGVILLVGTFVWRPGDTGDRWVPAAFSSDEWYPTYADEQDLFFEAAFDVHRQPRNIDMASTYLNVTDGRRHTWTPPDCECPRLTVWMYGGSTAFGLGQRDEHTPASALARRAWEDGIALDVVNKGVSGDLLWQEANRFAWDVVGEPPPDLVVFYDGVNETAASRLRNERGHGDDEEMIDLSTDVLRWDYQDGDWPAAPDPNADDTWVFREPREGPHPPEDVAPHVVARYERSREMARSIASAAGIPLLFFWQPSRFSRPPIDLEPQEDEDWRSLFVAVEDLVPDGTVDLTDVFDGLDAPLYYDNVHTNEEGARIIADAMYVEVRDVLDGSTETEREGSS